MTSLRFPVNGILFDCDGVLVDSLEPAAVAWDRWAATYSPGYDFRTQVSHGVRAADTVAELVAPDVLSAAIAALEEEEVRGADLTKPIAGSVALTRSLPAHVWAVVTSAARRLAVARLAASGHPIPKELVAAEDVEAGKPSPDPYLLGARLLGLDPDTCVVFEDAPAGVLAARRAGVRFVIGVGDHLEDAEVDARVEDLSTVRYLDGAIHLG
ncbi:phosphatase [Microbacterium sorbitolivorans]|uniref:HAD family hydrolase n=1 Tax=Microbacterium sorbitolivorans TaxID=1867410 RepID=A0A367Y2J3_9MICO|nr:HAD-IA family hydrolase [Microbacterium sorbitolivorans]RCK60095.1 HAD family hydrolase [Microbacterium sorbitolivorans]GGF42734.1 phosphatase [Microbacterium sorbitolivorans]